MRLRKPTTIRSIRFFNFKALGDFSIALRELNILVGVNNSGKSTVIGALRALEAALRIARARRPSLISKRFPAYHYGVEIPVDNFAISLENIHTNYNNDESKIVFSLSNNSTLILLFPDSESCFLTWESPRGEIDSIVGFRAQFPLAIQCIPILGPVEYEEQILAKSTVQRALGTHRASRHFRNYWRHFPDGFDLFSVMLSETWPGMEIERPEPDKGSGQSLVMFCKEKRLARELFWAGFGFQVWCQLLTHISRAATASILVADEPDLYLHAEVQRRLVSILRAAGPDVVLATHSSEIIGEADPSEILVIDKSKTSARRLRDIEGVQQALDNVGSIHNISLTNLARTRRILFVEGMDDYKRIRRFASRLGLKDLAAGAGITALESGGFSSWETVRSLAWGVKDALGADLKLAAIYDRDYRPDEEIFDIEVELQKHLKLAHLHRRKEMENYLLVPSVLERAIIVSIEERNRRVGASSELSEQVSHTLDLLSLDMRDASVSQYIAKYVEFFQHCGRDNATLTREAISRFNTAWSNIELRMCIVPGKELLRQVRERFQRTYAISLTDVRIIDAFRLDEIPIDLREMLRRLEDFRNI